MFVQKTRGYKVDEIDCRKESQKDVRCHTLVHSLPVWWRRGGIPFNKCRASQPHVSELQLQLGVLVTTIPGFMQISLFCRFVC